jgi:hypothetical protein
VQTFQILILMRLRTSNVPAISQRVLGMMFLRRLKILSRKSEFLKQSVRI